MSNKGHKLPTFETDRLLLKEVTLDYLDSYKKYFVDYEVIRHLSAAVPWPYPEDGVKGFLEELILPFQGKERWMWGIFLKENPDEIIGVVDLWKKGCPENRGFWLAKKHWGPGLHDRSSNPSYGLCF